MLALPPDLPLGRRNAVGVDGGLPFMPVKDVRVVHLTGGGPTQSGAFHLFGGPRLVLGYRCFYLVIYLSRIRVLLGFIRIYFS